MADQSSRPAAGRDGGKATGLRRLIIVGVGVLLLLLAGSLVWMIEVKVAGDMKLAGVAFRRDATLRAEDAAGQIDGKLRQIHQGLRTIGLLPAVRTIERHGENLDADAHETIQQLYNNLRLNVEISEVYITPATLNADRVDPATGRPEEPILTFDAPPAEGAPPTSASPAILSFKYHALQQQMAWLLTRQRHLQDIADARAAQIEEMGKAQVAIAEREARALRLAEELEANEKTLKLMLADLTQAKNAAEAASVSKSQFLANMSHEIRTPLNGVLGVAQVLASEDLAPAEAEKVNLILEAGKSLLVLLNDVLDLSKIEAGKLEIEPVPGDLNHTVSGTLRLFKAQADEKALMLTMPTPPELPRLSYDAVRVRQCISNLISNAIKFTSHGQVVVSVSARPLGDREHLIRVQVSDTGIGMNEDAMSRLFTAFTQADNSTTRRFGGTGLGLAISRALARKMGGDIRVRSEEGRGSVFALYLRAREAEPEAMAPAVEKKQRAAGSIDSLRGARVLLTDDNALNRKIIQLLLAPYGCAISEACNGKEALDLLAAEPFDIVLLDAHMPVMDGAEAIRRIRIARTSWRDIPVIALTADAMAGDREKYIALGMTDYLSKPVDKQALLTKMVELIAPASAAEPGAAAAVRMTGS